MAENLSIRSDEMSVKVSTDGAQLMSVEKNGTEYLWQGDPAYWADRAPVLFPAVGAVRNGRTIFEGKYYDLTKHGLVRHAEFAVREHTAGSVTLGVTDSEESLLKYPYHFDFSVKYEVKENVLSCEMTAVNTGSRKMPYILGGHPAFNVPFAGGKFEDYAVRFEKPETMSLPSINADMLIDHSQPLMKIENLSEIKLSHDLFLNDALIFDGTDSKKISLVSPDGKSIEMDYSDFAIIAVWSSRNGGPFAALEPWVGCATCTDEDDDFLSKRYVQILEPGEKKSYAFTVRING